MIFEPMITATAAHHRDVANLGQWGGMRSSPKAPENPERIHAERRAMLLDYACLPIDEAAKEIGFDTDKYREKADTKEALLFVTEAGEEFVPLWGFDLDGSINPVAVEAAKIYARHNPWADPSKFCRFMGEHYLVMQTSKLVAENDHKSLAQDFKDRLYTKFLKKAQPRAAVRTLMEAVTMAVGDNRDYVSKKLHEIMDKLLDVNHKPDSLESVMQELPTSRRRLGL